MNKFIQTSVAAAALVVASGAFAQKAGDNIYSVGVASVNPIANLGPLSNSTPYNGGPATYTNVLAGTTAKVSSEMTISVGWLHMYTDNIGAEVTFGIPPTVRQDLNSPSLGNHASAAKIDVWTPGAVAKYFFGTAQDKWRPYVGLGVSRVSFKNITISSDAAVQALAANSAQLSSSWTPIYNAGMVYNRDDKWSISGSVSYLPIKTSATFVGAVGTTTGDVRLNTIDYVLRLGYRF